MFFGCLPKKYHFSHRFSFELHDSIAEIVETGDLAELFLVRFQMPEPGLGEDFERLEQGEVLDWMMVNGFEREAQEVIYRTTVRALLIDFCHFVCECLKCSASGKLSVCHALMRKPFKETLFLLEWLLVDKLEFLERFEAGPENVDMYKLGAAARKDIVTRAVAAATDDEFLDADFIYEMRFEKGLHYSFEPLWNKAVHLITTDKNYRTETQNINFVFTGENDMESQWESLYCKLPYLMIHAVRVVEHLVRGIDEHFLSRSPSDVLRQSAAILLWSERLGYRGYAILETLFQDIFGEGQFACSQCKGRVPLDHRQAVWLYRKSMFRCNHCGTRYPLQADD